MIYLDVMVSLDLIELFLGILIFYVFFLRGGLIVWRRWLFVRVFVVRKSGFLFLIGIRFFLNGGLLLLRKFRVKLGDLKFRSVS